MSKPGADPNPPQRLDPTLQKLIEKAERAGVLAQRDELGDQAERRRRSLSLRSVVERLPAHIRTAKRGELIQRIQGDQLFRAVDGWDWPDGNLLLSGPTGLGKSSAAGHLVRRLCGRGVANGGEDLERAQAIRWQDALELMAGERETPLGDTPDVLQRCQRARLLVIDDLKAPVSLARNELLERTLQFRYDAGLPTVTTTGLSDVELLRAFGDALCRKLLECGGQKGRWVRVRATTPTASDERARGTRPQQAKT